MRVPDGAPTAGWLRLQQIFPYLKRYKFKRPPSGTLTIINFVGFTSLFAFVMFAMPKIYNDYYKNVQTHKRSFLNASKEELAQGLRPWSNPFEPPKS